MWTLCLSVLLAVSFQAPQQQPAGQSRPDQDRAVDSRHQDVSLDGQWTVVYVEKEGKPQEIKSAQQVTIRDNTVTCTMDGKQHSWKLEFLPRHMLVCTNSSSDRTAISAEKPGNQASSNFLEGDKHHGVYIASKEFFCVSLSKGPAMPETGRSSPAGADAARQPGQPIQQGQAGQPGVVGGIGMDKPHGGQFVLILRKSDSTESPRK